MARVPSLEQLTKACEPLSCTPGDTDEQRARKANFTLAMSLIIVPGLVWGLIYAGFGAWTAAAMPFAYSVLSFLNLLLLRRTRNFRRYQTAELALIVVLPFALQLALGGYVGGSAVVMWAVIGPLFAVLFAPPREARLWFYAFLLAVVVAGIAQPSITVDNPLPDWLIATFFVMNLVGVFSVVFAILLSFMRARERLRELEVAYLDQTVMLRQREKLATLGTLAAGVAHELNNPAAAVHRAASQLEPALARLRHSGVTLSGMVLTDSQVRCLGELIGADPPDAGPLSPLERSRREQDLEDWLDDHGVQEPWEVAPLLIADGRTLEDMDELLASFHPDHVAEVCSMMAHASATRSLAAGIEEGTTRISNIVGALRSYSYLDRGTVQFVDITEGIESTVVLLQNKLRDMRIEREYAPDLPLVQVRGSELNQVWTNIIDNAVDATGGTGTIVVRTMLDGDRVVVELEDDGAGMPRDVADRVFDPFFTTKPPGHGTGLGLNISHNIVVRQHGGDISVDSEPGRTRFRVALPIDRGE